MDIIGHRGASGYKPENTLASFQAAIAMGVDMIELDVFALHSGEVVVLHDDTVNRTTDGKGAIAEFQYGQLQRLDAGNGQHVPLLVEVLDLIHKRLPVNIELKGGNGIAPLVADIIDHYVTQKGWSYNLFLVSSYDPSLLREFAKLQPNVRLGVIYSELPRKSWGVSKKYNIYSANIDAQTVTLRDVRAAHARGQKVYVFTVNSRRQARKLRSMKVDGVFTNYPDKVSA